MSNETSNTASDGTSESKKDAPKGRTTRPEKAESEERIVVRLKKGQYVGLGCIDPEKRFRDEDIGEGFTHEHPARSFWKDVSEVDDNGYSRTHEEFVRGELIQLWPPLDHEKEAAEALFAKDKRHTFSAKEAQKRADRMVKEGIADLVYAPPL